MEEREALKRLKHREEDALAWFIDRYTAYVSTIVSNILGPAAASADLEAIASDVFFAFWTHAKRSGPERQKHISAASRGTRRRNPHAKPAESFRSKTTCLSFPLGRRSASWKSGSRRRTSGKPCSPCASRSAQIFLRYYYFYQPVSTIAEEMGLESANVKTKLFRGRKKLKEVLEKGGYFVEA